jgi:hypothetical protein
MFGLASRCWGGSSRPDGATSVIFSARASAGSGRRGPSTASERHGRTRGSKTFSTASSASVVGSSCGDAVRAEASRPAFYALRSGGWRDYITLLHLPYTAWHLSYVVIGAALTPEFSVGRLWPALLAFGLAVGIGAHALDELNGRPLRTEIPAPVLVALSGLSVAAAVAIGLVGAVTVDPWLAAFVAAGAFIVVAYNLEWFGGRFHNDLWFGVAWGAFPLLTAYFATAETLDATAVGGGVFACALSLAQRTLSTRVRDVRRRVARISGTIHRRDGRAEAISAEDLMGAPEAALRILCVAVVALAVALVMMRT